MTLQTVTVAEARRSRPLTGFLEQASQVDWDFKAPSRRTGLEGLHPYPAKFIPDLPGTLMDVLPIPKGSAVFDPFVGSGTTLVEAQRRGIASVGSDLNPIACLISRVKTSPVPGDVEEIVDDVLEQALGFKNITVPTIPNLNHWFSDVAQNCIARLVMAIGQAPVTHQDFLRLSLSSILVRVSNQDSDTRYAAINKNVNAAGVYKAFAGATDKVATGLRARVTSKASAKVVEGDTLQLRKADLVPNIGAVITSPPYPNAYEYWLYHKYRMWWLGFDPIAVKSKEIGARAHFFKSNPHTAWNFVEQMEKTFSLIDSVLLSGGFACFVIGRSKIHGEIVDNAKIIEDAGSTFGFRTAFRAERVISSTKKSFNLSHANIKTETILVLSK